MKKGTQIETSKDLRSFFLEECHNIVSKQGLSFSEHITIYLGDMLTRFTHSDSFFEESQSEDSEKIARSLPTIGVKFLESLQHSPFEQLLKMQQVGDFSLFLSGFFSDNIHRRQLDMDYFSAVGGQAYETAGHLRNTLSAEKQINVFFELAQHFEEVKEVLAELSDKQLLATSQDQLKLYKKWADSGNPRIKRMLGEIGLSLDGSATHDGN